MNKSLSRLLIVLFLAACLSSACAVNGGYWVPPHATVTRPAIKLAALETSIPVIDLPVTVQETVAPTLEPPEPAATEPAGDLPPAGRPTTRRRPTACSHCAIGPGQRYADPVLLPGGGYPAGGCRPLPG